MKKKTVSEIMLELFLISVLTMAFNISPVKAQPYVTVYVFQPLGYIPGVPVGEIVVVDIIIEVSGIMDDTHEGIVGWGMDVTVDPDVLEPFRPRGAMVGYFLYDFAADWGHPPPTLLPGTVDPDTGYWYDILETIMPTPPGGAGEGYSGRKLVTLWFYSRSETAHSRIDILNVEYYTSDGVWHPFDEVIDGNYNPPEVPEFPLGLALEILFIPVIIYMLWRSKQRKKMLP